MTRQRPAGPRIAWQLIRRFRYDLLAVLVVAAVMVAAADVLPMQAVSGIVPLLGIVVSVFIAFRNRNAYNRWWEARTLWGGVLINGRTLDYALTAYDDGSPEIRAIFDRMRRREVRYAWRLAAELQGATTPRLAELTPEDPVDCPAAELLSRQAADIATLSSNGLIDRQARRVLVTVNTAQVGTAVGLERIRHQPIPRYYDLFVRGLAWVFAILVCTRIDAAGHADVVGITAGILIMALFVIAERVGHLLEEPMSDNVFGLPLARFCTRLSGDLLRTP